MTLKTALYSHLKGAYGVAFTVNATTNVITASGHGRVDGQKIRLSTTNTLPAGLSINTDYFVRDMSGSTFKLAATYGGAAIDITDTGTGTHSLGTSVTDQVIKRIYAGNAPQNPTAPYITYRQISTSRQQTMSGPDGLVTARIQFDVFDDDPGTVETVLESLRIWLDGFDRKMGTEQLDVRLVRLEDVSDSPVNPVHGDETGIYNGTADYFITYAETVYTH